MSDRDRKRLREIHTFPALVKYLREDLGWPVEQGNFADLDEITFDWEADELGIDPDQAAKIEYIKQLRPLENGEPQGVFFVKFNAKSLPVVALRRLLSKLVIKKRATATAAERPLWAMRDLVFISSYGSSEERQLSFAYFQESEQKTELPTLKVLGWDDRDTALHLDRVHDLLTSHLTWPANTKSLPVWRKDWSKAFELRHGQVVSTAKELAEQLASLARGIRERANQLLRLETEKGPLRILMSGFKAALIHDLTDDQFADMYAQTIAYGLLSARITHPDSVNAETLPDLIPVTNPFLKELMETFVVAAGKHRGRKKGLQLDFDELGINEVVELLRRANMDAVLRNFGAGDRREDPVTYFYEDFLNAYDSEERKRRGVYYTPMPIVSYIVRSVDELLKTDFGIEDGLASTVTWGEMTTRHKDLRIPPGLNEESPFIQILDPATGTATFLVEVIDVVLTTLKARWTKEGLSEAKQIDAWNLYVSDHLLPRLHGYELMMAPYAIAHLKIGLKLFSTGYRFATAERARIYLTNALEPATDASNSQVDALSEALAHEVRAVNAIKRGQRFTIVMGNPPYSVSSWNKSDWIEDLTEEFKRTVRAEESQIQSLSNDYIKFLRFGEWQIETTGVGMLGLITGHGYLQGTQPRDLRNHLTKVFDRCDCLDLHGSIRRSGTEDIEDEPVFEIMTGVAILIGQRAFTRESRGGTVLESLTGRLAKKWQFLNAGTARSHFPNKTPYQPVAPNYLFAPPKTANAVGEQYANYIDLPAMFGTGVRSSDKETYWATGFASQQDELAMSFTNDELEDKIAALADAPSFEKLKEQYRLCSTDQWNFKLARSFARDGEWREYVSQVAYRPFDRRWTVLHKSVLTILRTQVMSQLGEGTDNLGLISSRAVNDLRFAHCFVTTEPVDKIFISSKTSTNAYVFPMFFMKEDMYGKELRHNFSPHFMSLLSNALGRAQSATDGLPDEVTAEDIFSYIYGVLSSPGYRVRFAEDLRIDFPRVPLPGGAQLFQELARLGGQLIALHTLKSTRLNHPITKYKGPRNPEVGRISWSDDTVWLDAEVAKRGGDAAAGTIGFQGVPEVVWNFHIGGYQVCEKWLKDRKGRLLSASDIQHYHTIVVALSETIHNMEEIDNVIEKHGGWPDAFQTLHEKTA
jgi:Type ISP C-terminal specificity domain